jgi:glycosyltransferase involved in cell wall biosynthesis
MFCSLRDSTGSQLLEAMAYGLPVITLNHQGAGDHVPDNAAIKVDVTTPEETVHQIARAVEKLYDHPDQCAQMGNHGHEFAKTCTWKNRIKKLAEFYPLVTASKTASNVL